MLDSFQAEIDACTVNCFFLEPSNSKGAPEGTRLGGNPLLARGVQWPAGKRPLDFIGQLNFAEFDPNMSASLGLPTSGVLAFFYDTENQPWGFEPGDSTGWSLKYVRAVNDAAVVTPPPGAISFPERACLAKVGKSIPGFGDDIAPEFLAESEDDVADAYFELRDELAPSCHQVRGHADWVQDDARLECALVSSGGNGGGPEGYENVTQAQRADASNWNLLWQIGSDDTFMWGDLGNLFLMIRDQDLSACAFDKAWLVLQCT